MRDSLECIDEVLSHWLDPDPESPKECNYPVSWEGLYKLLEDVELKDLVTVELKQALDSYTLH